MAASSSAHDMPVAAPPMAQSAKRALRKRKLQASLEDGSATFGTSQLSSCAP